MRYALVYGGMAGAIVIGVLVAGLAFDLHSHATSEWFGYLVMLVALSLIFVGIKRYRDVECGGVIRFGRAFGLGLGIAAVAALVYVVVWEIYLAASGVDFMAQYTGIVVDGMRSKGASAAEIEAKVAEMREMAEMYRNPLLRIPITFVEIFPVGLLVALVSAALLRNPKVLPAQR
ncbi:MAG TPA: DUF4199 domain-containing protein [Allosphingosinicella sp.]